MAKMAEIAVLKPMLIKTTGPLIRVIGDRNTSSVKSASMSALLVLMERGGLGLKAFVPQLQSTFIKSLQDPSRDVRLKGATALGRLMTLGPKIDLLLTELSNICGNADSMAIRGSVIEAIVSVLREGGSKASAVVLGKVRTAVVDSVYSDDDVVQTVASRGLSVLSVHMDSADVTDLLMDLIDGAKGHSQDSNHRASGRLTGCASVLQGAGEKVEAELREEAFELLRAGVKDVRSVVKGAACTALAILFTPPPAPTPSSSSSSSSSADTVGVDGAAIVADGQGQAAGAKATARAAVKVFLYTPL